MTLFDRAKKVIPGGVNSPVRAFGNVQRDPIFFDHAKGAYLYDVDGNRYMDFIGSWGPMILGHGNEELAKKGKAYFDEVITFGLPSQVEVEMAELFTQATGTEMVRMVNSGTEATMSAIRLARGYTGRKKIVKFEGCYHGHSDALLVQSGSGMLTYNTPTSLGVPEDVVKDTVVCRYNDLASVEKVFEAFPEDIALVIVEPVACNMGMVPPKPGFLQGLREITKKYRALLIFDEVITGFRVRYGSVAPLFDVKPDLYCFGKIIGGGLPVGAFAGDREIMELLSPLGGVYQAGTLSGNPLAMKLGRDTLLCLKNHPEIYRELEKNAETLAKGLEENLREAGIPGKVTGFHSMVGLFFGEFEDIASYDDVKQADALRYGEYFRKMVEEGVLFAPSPYEGIFLSHAHTPEMIEETLEKSKKVMKSLR